MVRFILFLLVCYLLYQFVRSLLGSGRPRQQVKGRPRRVNPPPYDPSQVEDIDYQEVKEDEES